MTTQSHQLKSGFNTETNSFWIYNLFYFSELFLLWAIPDTERVKTLTSTLNFLMPVIKFLHFTEDGWILQSQGVFILLGGIFWGWRAEYSSNLNKLLRCSILTYAVASIFAALFWFLFIGHTDNEYYAFSFLLCRLISCFGISGGVGISLTTIAYKEENEPLRKIAYFCFGGAMGVVVCDILLSKGIDLFWVLLIGGVVGIYVYWKTKGILFSGKGNITQSKSSEEDLSKFEKTHKNRLPKIISNAKFIFNYSCRAIQIALLGAPTFFITSFYASRNEGNKAAYIIAWEYSGLAIAYLLLTIPKFEWLKNNRTRKWLLVFGLALQFIFWRHVINYPDIRDINEWVLFSAGIGMGNWAIVFMLIVEQEEFKKCTYFSASFIPNLMRSVIIVIPILNPVFKSLLSNVFIKKSSNSFDTVPDEIVNLFPISCIYILIGLVLCKINLEGKKNVRNRAATAHIKEILWEKMNVFLTFLEKKEKKNIEEKFEKLKECLGGLLEVENIFKAISIFYFDSKGKPQFIKFTEKEKNSNNVIEPLYASYLSSSPSEKPLFFEVSLNQNIDCILVYRIGDKYKDILTVERVEGVTEIDLRMDTKDILKAKFTNNGSIQPQLESSINRHREVATLHSKHKNYYIYLIRPKNFKLKGFDMGIFIYSEGSINLEYLDYFRHFLSVAMLNMDLKKNKKQVTRNTLKNKDKPKIDIQQIRTLLARSNTEGALNILRGAFSEDNEVIIQLSRLSRLNRDDRTGQLSFDEANRERNKIIEGVLEKLREWETDL